jgi:hypothetical protein
VVVVGVVAVLGVAIAAVSSNSRTELPAISGIEYSQSKAVAGFIGSSHRTTNPRRIADFTALVTKYSIDVTRFDRALNDVCTGGLATDISLEFADTKTTTFRIYDCGRTVPRGTFVSDTSALFTRWRAADDA